MKNLILSFLLVTSTSAFSQNIESVFNSAYQKFASDKNFKHASISLYVVNTKTGKPVTEVNAQMGLAPASTQKIITSATFYALMGKDYTYSTTLGYTGKIENGILNGDLIIKGSGDPTLGSWRYDNTKEVNVINLFKNAISQAGIHEITGHVIGDESAWNDEATPDGWVWQDIGSYYGAGARALNWRENQYDLLLKSGTNINDAVEVAGTIPSFVDGLNLHSEATTAAKGTGDNAYIYFPLNTNRGTVRGTIPAGGSKFKISGAMPHPAKQLALTLEAEIKKTDIKTIAENYPEDLKTDNNPTVFYTYSSPTLDSISYWFLKKSINLYGEALVKTLGQNEFKNGSTRNGVKAVQKFWKSQGIEPYAINMMDGSGLSPGNRITTESLVRVLQYSKKQSWFDSYYDGFPVFNGIKMKSGSINGVISYTGFVTSKKGEEYTFAFIVNNYDGSGNELRRKMWALLDLLK